MNHIKAGSEGRQFIGKGRMWMRCACLSAQHQCVSAARDPVMVLVGSCRREPRLTSVLVAMHLPLQ